LVGVKLPELPCYPVIARHEGRVRSQVVQAAEHRRRFDAPSRPRPTCRSPVSSHQRPIDENPRHGTKCHRDTPPLLLLDAAVRPSTATKNATIATKWLTPRQDLL